LVTADTIEAGAEHVLLGSGRRGLARATLDGDGFIVWKGQRYASPSDRAFGRLQGRAKDSINGWSHWHVLDADRTRPLAELRQNYITAKRDSSAKPGTSLKKLG